MSQAEIGILSDTTTISSSISQPTLQTNQFTEMLKQELSICEEKCDQAYLFLTETRERLRLAQQLIQLQENSVQALQERVSDLEHQLQAKSEQLSLAKLDREELRDRLRREKHNSHQLKTALEKCLENPNLSPSELKSLHKVPLEVAKSADNHKNSDLDQRIEPPQFDNPLKIESYQNPCQQPTSPVLESTKFIQDLAKTRAPVETPVFSGELNSNEENLKIANSFASIKLPQFPPLQRR